MLFGGEIGRFWRLNHGWASLEQVHSLPYVRGRSVRPNVSRVKCGVPSVQPQVVGALSAPRAHLSLPLPALPGLGGITRRSRLVADMTSGQRMKSNRALLNEGEWLLKRARTVSSNLDFPLLYGGCRNYQEHSKMMVSKEIKTERREER